MYNQPKQKPNDKTKQKPKDKTDKTLSTIKRNIINKSNIPSYNKKKLLSHGIHHTKKHIVYMIKKLKQGNNFTNSHKMTQEKIGS